MRYRLPSLNALRALEAAGRRGSLSAAAKELGVSVGAISRHISLLEGHFGRTLLRRRPSGVEATPDCAGYLRVLERAFDDIDKASHNLATERGRTNTLRLRFYSTFTTEWLSARLGSFRARHPDIRLDFNLSIKDAEWRDDDFDMALTGRAPASEEFRSDRLFDTYLALICAPGSLPAGPRLHQDDILRQTLLTSPRETHLWGPLLTALDIPTHGDQAQIVFDSLSMTYQAARQGAGIALGNLFMVTHDLEERRLTIATDKVFAVSLPHYIVTRRGRADSPALAAFRTWLLEEARDAGKRLYRQLTGYQVVDLPIAFDPPDLSGSA